MKCILIGLILMICVVTIGILGRKLLLTKLRLSEKSLSAKLYEDKAIMLEEALFDSNAALEQARARLAKFDCSKRKRGPNGRFLDDEPAATDS
jgi:hypothetical protein